MRKYFIILFILFIGVFFIQKNAFASVSQLENTSTTAGGVQASVQGLGNSLYGTIQSIKLSGSSISGNESVQLSIGKCDTSTWCNPVSDYTSGTTTITTSKQFIIFNNINLSLDPTKFYWFRFEQEGGSGGTNQKLYGCGYDCYSFGSPVAPTTIGDLYFEITGIDRIPVLTITSPINGSSYQNPISIIASTTNASVGYIKYGVSTSTAIYDIGSSFEGGINIDWNWDFNYNFPEGVWQVKFYTSNSGGENIEYREISVYNSTTTDIFPTGNNVNSISLTSPVNNSTDNDNFGGWEGHYTLSEAGNYDAVAVRYGYTTSTMNFRDYEPVSGNYFYINRNFDLATTTPIYAQADLIQLGTIKAISPLITFQLSATSSATKIFFQQPALIYPTSSIGSVVFFNLDDCGAVSWTDWTGLPCLLVNTFKNGINNITNSIYNIFNKLVVILKKVFPLSIFFHLQNDFDIASNNVSGGSEIVLNGNQKIFGAKTFNILTSNTFTNISNNFGFDFRDLFNKIIYTTTGLIIIIQTLFVINHLRKEKHNNI